MTACILMFPQRLWNSLPALCLLLHQSSWLELRMWDSNLMAQTGVLAIAFAFDICCGKDPCSVRFDHKSIRHHLAKCLEDSKFPILSERNSCGIKHVQKTELHGSCLLPETIGVDQMAECDACKVWYHQHCMDIPSEVFNNPDVPWKCKWCGNLVSS